MQADVFPVPTAPRIATPVYKPRCGIVNQSGVGARPGVVVKWVSPSTSDGALLASGAGYRGSRRVRTLGAWRYATIARTDRTIDPAKNGVENHIVAYPYVRTWKTVALCAAIRARTRLSGSTGYACSPHVPTPAAITIAPSPRASTTVRSMVAFLSSDQLTSDDVANSVLDGGAGGRRRPAPPRVSRTRVAPCGTNDCGWSMRHFAKSLSFASTVSITWLST